MAMARLMTSYLPVVPLVVPGNGEQLPDTRRSDHTAFWEQGFPAVMLTDTANFRNPHYHQPTDTLETLNLDFMASVANGVTAAVLALAGVCMLMSAKRMDRHITAVIAAVFDRLDYRTLGRIYCYQGGKEFWQAKRKPCQRLGMQLAKLSRSQDCRQAAAAYTLEPAWQNFPFSWLKRSRLSGGWNPITFGDRKWPS